MIEEEFRQLVDTKVATGTSFVGAVYQAMDEAAAEEDQGQWACHKGCSFCCKQMVQVTSGEINEIIKYLNGLRRKKRKRVMDLVWKRVKTYITWFDRLGGEMNPNLSDQLWVHDQWLNKPCPFLSGSGVCSVHPARPIDCRTMHSTAVCKDWNEPGAARMPHEYEGWANNMILEQEEKARGAMAVAPIHHWLKVKEKRISK